MFKLIRGKTSHATTERIKLQKELFSFKKSVTHGFPHHSSALAYDPLLNLLAIGTRHGLIRIYGKPGVEFQSALESDVEIRSLLFIENRAQLVSLSADNCLHLWQIRSKQRESGGEIGVLEKVKSCDYFWKEASKEGSLKQITTISINSNNDRILIGTQSGNTNLLDLERFELADQDIIYQDVVLQNIPDDYKFNPGSVEVISEQPLNPNKFLIGYNRGLLVLWDNNAFTVDHFYCAKKQLESVCWLYNGQQFLSSHNDGSYVIWNINDNSQQQEEQEKIPYGPFPCKAINKMVWKTAQNREDLLIFSGGMPRSTYNDKNTVSIIEGKPENGKHHVLDFTSKVIDFYVIAPRNNDTDADNPSTLIVLVEEEIVLIDLTHPDWLQFRLPYLASVHSSAITCCQHYCDVSQELYQKIVNSGEIQNAGKFTSKEWPINGGTVIEPNIEPKMDLLITGHEDGSVRFWDASSVAMHHLYTLSTSKFFLAIDDDITPIDSDDTGLNETNAEDEWPPFRKVGTFDPYSDDPRLAIRKVLLCIYDGTLIVAGTAGQVIVFKYQSQSIDKSLTSNVLNIVGDKDGFIWKGHGQLVPKNGNLKFEIGFQPSTIIQLLPPAAVTSLSLHSEWGLVAAGTAHGFGLFDYIQQKLVITKTTLNPNDLTAASGGDALISRRKSFKKSLRESFRRLRKGRSQRAAKRTDRSPTPSSSSPAKSLEEGRKSPRVDDTAAHLETKPVERQIEARSSEDSMGSMVRCLYFAPAFIINNATQTPSLWAGTNAGTVLIFTINLPSDEKRNSSEVVCQLAKEIQLKHRAPVVTMQIIDSNGLPLPDSFEVKFGKAKPATLPGHRILICSEEQFKLFNLPNLKPLNKYKLTAHEGARARRIGIARFVSKSNENYSEYCLLCLSNLGDISIFTIPELKRQLVTVCTKREDINGISSLVFTKQGEGFYLHSSCEFRRFSLSARHIVNSVCNVNLLKQSTVSKQIEYSSPTVTSIIEEVSPESSETEGILSKGSNDEKDVETEETPTSGIGESPITPIDLTLPEVNYNTLPNASEILNHNEENLLNGTNEIENNHSFVENGENDDTLNLTNDSSIDKNNMDITIDSVKDHITYPIHNSNNDKVLNTKS